MGIMDFLSGLGSGAQLRKLQKVADQVNSIEEEFQAMSDAELREETDSASRTAKTSTASCPRPSASCGRHRCAY